MSQKGDKEMNEKYESVINQNLTQIDDHSKLEEDDMPEEIPEEILEELPKELIILCLGQWAIGTQ